MNRLFQSCIIAAKYVYGGFLVTTGMADAELIDSASDASSSSESLRIANLFEISMFLLCFLDFLVLEILLGRGIPEIPHISLFYRCSHSTAPPPPIKYPDFIGRYPPVLWRTESSAICRIGVQPSRLT